MKPAARREKATYADIEALPEHVVGELIGGELFVSPRPTPLHSHAMTALSGMLSDLNYSSGSRRSTWIVLTEPELHLGHDVYVPDLAGWRRERLPALPKKAYFDVAPDWVCEILSPSTSRVDRVHKMPRYAKRGITHAWIVDPPNRILDVMVSDGKRWTVVATHTHDDRAVIEPFEVEINLSRLWPEAVPSVHDRGPTYDVRRSARVPRRHKSS